VKKFTPIVYFFLIEFDVIRGAQYATKNNAKNSNDFRTWTIPEKGKTFVAKFINLQDNRVNLQITTGRAAFIDIKLLSETDQEWIRSKLQDGG
jgi:hypothetical protein